MRTFISIFALAFLSNAAFAQASKFEGLNVGVGLAYVQPKITEKDSVGGHYTWNNADMIPQLSLTYNFSLTDKWLLGVGGSYDLSQLNAGTTRGLSGLVKATLDDHSSIYLQPTFALDDKSAIYAKVAYHEVKVETVGVAGAGWVPDRFRTSGLGYGVGYTRLFGKHVFVQGEIQMVAYDDKRLVVGGVTAVYSLPEETIAQVTLGYKF
ncbi:outer membrane beta-barrel protein [Rhodoferax sp.]|uniref:outer membrane beta-barrel protein n=1 Tax=Rhodoferax sp. TaxID=50421 RepID=UPI002ACEB77E|nr:outer membrane beta-barrel protein [Rhodoferax sp.]MDZ7921556.1 outer membrane beta-barrel protein [Rhodoferax sp.]